jgi:hypothetical protein
MDPHSIVVVSLHTPKEKVWGELLDINPSGVTLRGIDLNSFDILSARSTNPTANALGFRRFSFL